MLDEVKVEQWMITAADRALNFIAENPHAEAEQVAEVISEFAPDPQRGVPMEVVDSMFELLEDFNRQHGGCDGDCEREACSRFDAVASAYRAARETGEKYEDICNS